MAKLSQRHNGVLVYQLFDITGTCKEMGNMLLHPVNRCMQDAHSCFQAKHDLVCKHAFAYKFIMITFPGGIIYEYLHLCN